MGKTVVAKLTDVTAEEATQRYRDPFLAVDEPPSATSDVFSLARTLRELFEGAEKNTDRRFLSTLDEMISRSPDLRPGLIDLQAVVPDVKDKESISTTDLYSYSIRTPMVGKVISLACLTLGSVFFSWWNSEDCRFIEQAQLHYSDDEMNQVSKELVAKILPEAEAQDSHSGYFYAQPYAAADSVANNAICFYYRQSPRYLFPLTTSIGRNLNAPSVDYSDPPFSSPGAISCVLDNRQRLREFRSCPGIGWTAELSRSDLRALLFSSAGLPFEGWRTLDEPSTNPMEFPGELTTTWGNALGVRVQLSTARGIPTWFAVGDSDSWTVNQDFVQGSQYAESTNRVTNGLMLLGFVYAGFLIFSNRRLIDQLCRNVGVRIAIVTATLLSCGWIGTSIGQLKSTLRQLDHGIANAVFWGVVAFVFALAVEPAWRRVSPRLVKSWFNFWSLEWDQPNVGFDMLLANAVASATAAFVPATNFFLRDSILQIPPRLGYGLPPPESVSILSSKVFLFAFLIETFANSLIYTIWLGIMAILLQSIFSAFKRAIGTFRSWMRQETVPLRLEANSFRPETFLSVSILICGFFSAHFANDLYWIPYGFAFAAVFAAVSLYRGLLASMFMIFSFITIVYTPMTLNTSSWYGDVQLVGLLAISSTTLAGLAICIRPMWFTRFRRSIIRF